MKITCKETLHCLPDFLNGRLEPAESDRVHHHLQDCRRCSLVVSSARSTLQEFFSAETKTGVPAETCPA